MKTITLNNGITMPRVGFGTYLIKDHQVCRQAVLDAIAAGYRLIDTAQIYGNEEAVGAAVKASDVPREELFITTKIWFKSHETEDARASLEESFARLGLDYVDLVLIHWPFGNTYAAYRVLEEFYEAKRVRAIGVSNFTAGQLVDLIKFNKVVPAVNQVESNLLSQQQDLHKVMTAYGVCHQAYAPFGQGKHNEMFDLPVVKEIAAAHGKTGRQVALRYFIQNDVTVLPKSIHPERMKANIDIFDFVLTPEEMERLKAVDTKQQFAGNPLDPAVIEDAMTW